MCLEELFLIKPAYLIFDSLSIDLKTSVANKNILNLIVFN